MSRETVTDALRIVLGTLELEELTRLRKFRDEIFMMQPVLSPMSFQFYLHRLVQTVSRVSSGENTMINILFDDYDTEDATGRPWMLFADETFSSDTSYIMLDTEETIPLLDYDRIAPMLRQNLEILECVKELQSLGENATIEYNVPSEGIALLSIPE